MQRDDKRLILFSEHKHESVFYCRTHKKQVTQMDGRQEIKYVADILSVIPYHGPELIRKHH